MGSHGLLEKCVMYEEAVKVPLLVRLPGQPESRRIMGPVSQVDLIPTLLDYLGEPIPPHLEGVSLRRMMSSSNGTAVTVLSGGLSTKNSIWTISKVWQAKTKLWQLWLTR